jgi:hypothetical protein
MQRTCLCFLVSAGPGKSESNLSYLLTSWSLRMFPAGSQVAVRVDIDILSIFETTSKGWGCNAAACG